MALSTSKLTVSRWRVVLTTIVLAAVSPLPVMGAPTDQLRSSIVVTIAPLQYFVREIGGEELDIRVLVEAGASPHTWEPSARQMSALEDADLMLGLGMPFEGAIMRRIRRIAPQLRVVDLSASIETALRPDGDQLDGGAAPHDHGELDPHIWLSPVIAQQIAASTTEALGSLEPSRASEYQRRMVLLQQRLQETHERLLDRLSSVRGGSIVVLHPAFGHFCRAYGLRQIPIQPSGTEPSSRQLVELVRFAREHEVRAILVQPQFSARSARKVADEIQAELIEVDPLVTDLDRLFERLGELVSSYAVPSAVERREGP